MATRRITAKLAYVKAIRRGSVKKTEATVRGVTKSLIYTPWFKKFVRNNSGAIRAFLEARKTGKDLQTGNITVKRIERTGEYHLAAWKVSVGKKSFFVKEVSEDARGVMGNQQAAYQQVRSLMDLEKIKAQNIEIAKYHVAWKNGSTTFLATDYYDLKLVSPSELPKALRQEWKKFSEKAEKRFGIWDLKPVFYDEKRRKIIITDPARWE